MLVFSIMGVAVDPRSPTGPSGPLVIGAALGVCVMVIGPLTGAGLNPARAFGPALVSGEFGGAGDFLVAFVLAPVPGRGRRGVVLLPPLPHARREGTGGPGAGRLSGADGSGP